MSTAQKSTSTSRNIAWAGRRLDTRATPGEATETGLPNNVEVGLRYIESWLRGVGAAGINNLMEDVATAEISAPRCGSGCTTVSA